MARLIRTEKEVEGRYEEVWLVVDEDALEQWPEGPREIVGRPGDARRRARAGPRRGDLHRRPAPERDAAHRRPALAARLRDRAADRPRARARAARRACGGRPGRDPAARPRLRLPGRRRRGRLRRLVRARAGRGRGDRRRVGRPRAAARPRRGRAAAARCSASRACASAATTSADSPRPTSSSPASTRPPSSCTTRWRRTRRSSSGSADGIEVHISTQYIWGIRAAVAEGLELPPDKVRVICHYMGGGFGSKNGPDDYTFIAAELAKRTGRPVKCALTRREENLAAGNRNATIQRLTVGARSDGTLTALGGDFVNAVGWSGWSSGTEGPMQMLYACPNVRTTTYAAKINQPPMKAFRAPGLRRGDVRARGAARRARRPSSTSTRSSCAARTTPSRTRPTGGRTAASSCSSATAAPSRTGSAGTRCARARPTPSSAASGWRRRSGTAAAARRATRGSASAPTGTQPSSRRCRTSAPARRPRWRRSPPRSSASRSST